LLRGGFVVVYRARGGWEVVLITMPRSVAIAVIQPQFECIELFHGIRNDILCLSVCICISVRSISVYLWWSPGCQSRGFPTAICRLDDRINKASPPRRPIYIFVCQLQSPPGVCAGICACSFLHIYIISIVSCVFACHSNTSVTTKYTVVSPLLSLSLPVLTESSGDVRQQIGAL
jgi:hypothetical protein